MSDTEVDLVAVAIELRDELISEVARLDAFIDMADDLDGDPVPSLDLSRVTTAIESHKIH
ncbi:MAG: hypothetical protein OEN23_15085 [Paracoccaceae bacterium]|nr:hypothetical protein [Paracoccaceae bacterium]